MRKFYVILATRLKKCGDRYVPSYGAFGIDNLIHYKITRLFGTISTQNKSDRKLLALHQQGVLWFAVRGSHLLNPQNFVIEQWCAGLKLAEQTEKV